MALRKREDTDSGRGNTRWHCVENSLWKELWFSRKADDGMYGGLLRVRVKWLHYSKQYYLCTIFSKLFRFEESKFTNVFVTDLYSPVVKPVLCSAMLEVLRWASHNSLGKATPCKSEYPEGSEYVRHTTGRHTSTILELKLKKCSGCLWQGTSGKLRWALFLQSWRKMLYFLLFQGWLIYLSLYLTFNKTGNENIT
jgi:hypothetical protein